MCYRVHCSLMLIPDVFYGGHAHLGSEGDCVESLWLGAFVGFLVTLIFEWMFPGIGHLVGEIIGGFGGVHGWGVGRGALAGFLAVLFGGIIFARFVFTGFAW